MARPQTKGLRYFPKDVDYYDDYKIVDLLNQYGPIGQTIYDVVLTLVYREGYYLRIPENTLALMIVRLIGNRWVPKKDLVLQVIHYCADIGLFDKDLLSQGVLTSAGIQKRYLEATVRNKVDTSKFWLLDDSGEPGESAPEKEVSAAKTGVSDTETGVNAAKTPINKNKLNKRKGKESERGAAAPSPAPAQQYGHYLNVVLTESEYADLQDELGGYLEIYIEKLSNHMASKSVSYSNHGATIRKWFAEDKVRGKLPSKGDSSRSYDIEAFDKGGFDLPDPPSFDLEEFKKQGFDLPDIAGEDDDERG